MIIQLQKKNCPQEPRCIFRFAYS